MVLVVIIDSRVKDVEICVQLHCSSGWDPHIQICQVNSQWGYQARVVNL